MHFQRALLCCGRKLSFSHSSSHDVRYFLICLSVTVTRTEKKRNRYGGVGEEDNEGSPAVKISYLALSYFIISLSLMIKKSFLKFLQSHSELSIIRLDNFWFSLTLYIAFPLYLLPCLPISSSASFRPLLRALSAKSTPQPPRFHHPLHGRPATISSTLRSLIRFPIRLRTSRSLSRQSWPHCQYRELEVGPRG